MLTVEDETGVCIHRAVPLSEPNQVNLHIQVGDIDQPDDKLREAGVEFAAPPQETEWVYRTAVCHDPGGHTVERFTPNRA